MKRDKEVTKVIFRKKYWKDTKEWDVEAYFPGASANRGCVMMYAHNGQHGEASLEHYHSTKPAKPREYSCLKKELEGLYGYRFKVVKRMSWKDCEDAWHWSTPEGEKELLEYQRSGVLMEAKK
jgi:hypothetical protein